MEHTPILPAGDSLSAAERFSPSILGIEPLSAVARALAGFNREQLGSAIEVLIALMDVADGDPDLEQDDRDGETIALIDDPDLEENGTEDDFTAHPVNGPGCPIADPGGAGESEDEEEDDDAGQCTEDEVSFGDPGFGSRGPGCTISDSDLCAVDRGELTTEEGFAQGEGSASHKDDDDEPRRVPPQWPLGDGEGFRFRPPH